MTAFDKINLRRDQLKKFLPDNNAIREFERLFRQDTELSKLVLSIIDGAGLNDDGTYPQRTGSNYLDASTSLYEDGTILDDELKQVQDELDDTQTGAGLNNDGSYIQPTTSNFLNASVSLYNAILILDTIINRTKVLEVSTNTALTEETQTVLVDATSGDIGITLPNPVNMISNSRSRKIGITKTDTTTNRVNILPFGSEKVAFENRQELLRQAECLVFVTNGTDWIIAD